MQRGLQHSLNTIIMTSPSPTVQISNIRKSSRQRRPVIPEIGYVQPTLAEWAHLVVEPSDSSRGSIFLGPQQAAGKNKLVALKEASPPITAIVNCTNVFPNHHESEFITYCRIAVNDEAGANILVYLEGAVKFIRHHILKGSSVLVHCQMGVSRSSTVIIAYLMQYRSMSRAEAYTHVKKRRPMANPNPGFWAQLEIYSQRLEREKCADGAITSTKETTFNKDWAESSLATYQTIGHITNNPVELFQEITVDCNMAEIMYIAVDYVFGRGILDADLLWLSALCASYRVIGVDTDPLIDDILAKGSEFMEMWYGEVYPEGMEKIKAASLVNTEKLCSQSNE